MNFGRAGQDQHFLMLTTLRGFRLFGENYIGAYKIRSELGHLTVDPGERSTGAGRLFRNAGGGTGYHPAN